MKENIEEIIENLGEEISGGLSFTEQHHIFTVNGEAEKLDKDRSNFFTP